MTKEEFIKYAEDEQGCRSDGKIVRNTINGRYTRIDDSFDEERDLHAVHHICVLGIAPPDDLEDLYNVYSPMYWSLVNNEPLPAHAAVTLR
jgi:hypothetical protein